MIVVPDSVDPSFIKRQQGQKVPNQLLTVGIKAQRVAGEQDCIVIAGTEPEVTDDDHGRLDKNRVQSLALLQNPFGIFAVQERPLVPV